MSFVICRNVPTDLLGAPAPPAPSPGGEGWGEGDAPFPRSSLCLRQKSIAAVFLLAATSPEALACATCFGTPQDAQTQGMNAAIFTLLGITAAVLSIAGGFGAMILWRMRGSE